MHRLQLSPPTATAAHAIAASAWWGSPRPWLVGDGARRWSVPGRRAGHQVERRLYRCAGGGHERSASPAGAPQPAGGSASRAAGRAEAAAWAARGAAAVRRRTRRCAGGGSAGHLHGRFRGAPGAAASHRHGRRLHVHGVPGQAGWRSLWGRRTPAGSTRLVWRHSHPRGCARSAPRAVAPSNPPQPAPPPQDCCTRTARSTPQRPAMAPGRRSR